MAPGIDRVYDDSLARELLDWHPKFDFPYVLNAVSSGVDRRSDIARVVGTRLYHAEAFDDGPYPVE